MKPTLPIRRAILNKRTYDLPGDGREGKLRLDLNENTAGCSSKVPIALARLSTKHIAMYPEYRRVSARIARYFGVRPEELLLANGADDALRVFFDACVDPRSGVLFCDPTFPMYRFYAENFGARITAPRYTREMDFPLNGFLRALRRKPRVAIIANPNNPTGTLLDERALRQIANAATQTALVIDEAYADFSGITVVPWIRRYPNLFAVRTFSKTAGLAALRLGCVIGNAKSIALLRGVMPPYAVNLAALVAAEAAIRDRKWLRRYVLDVKKVRAEFARALETIGVQVFPSAGNFLLANFGPAGPALFQRLERRGILLRPRTRDIGAGFVRITIGTRAEMNRLLREIERNR
ncbi:MAG: aminotransferase class I/II-fold pyridoxal phosphate-dependent enzyme [Candidatus Acidiferrales bacterium]